MKIVTMSTDSETLTKVPPNLALTALLSSGITIVSSICYIILCIIALVYRFNCDVAAAGTTGNAQFTWHTVYKVYFQDEECEHALPMDHLTQPHTVFVLVTLTLCFSVLTLIAGILLTVAVGVKKQEWSRYLNVIVTAYITCWVGSLAVDITFASHLGMDYGYLTQQLRDAPEYFFALDTLRHGAFVLMSVSLKGYVTLALNMVLICLLIIYSYVHQNTSNKEQHSIHKMGALNAFDQQRRVEDNWGQPDPISPYASSFSRGKTNNAYVNDNDQLRSLPRSDFYHTPSQSFNRSDSWQHQPQSSHGSRPFSYMEEMRRAPAPAQPASPAASSQEPRRREPWPAAPPVPAPDYSPLSPRRLKSALKPAGYM